MYATNEQTLVLDQSYQPLGVVPWWRAVEMWFKEKVEIVSEYDGFARSTSVVIKIPAVVRLLRAFRRHKKPVKFSRVNIYGRDDYRCLYCGERFPMDELTYDHVVPRSQGGKTTWENIATACSDCNGKKAGRTPEQAGMKLRKQPVQPTAMPAAVIQLSKSSVPDAWRDFLYWTGELDKS
jgi:5-methylcytosine-specific restriction endonuclease McrA